MLRCSVSRASCMKRLMAIGSCASFCARIFTATRSAGYAALAIRLGFKHRAHAAAPRSRTIVALHFRPGSESSSVGVPERSCGQFAYLAMLLHLLSSTTACFGSPIFFGAMDARSVIFGGILPGKEVAL